MGCIFRILKLLINVFIVIILILLINGFYIYKKAINNVSIEDKVFYVKSKDSYTDIENISNYLKDFIVDVEDKRFYSHKGIDLIVIARALVSNLNVGYYKYGGSTITQQLAKNMYFSGEKKIVRKVAEMFIAFDLERKYSKDDILEMYLNIIYFGNGYYGIKDASYGYFNVSPKNLNEYQSSLLVGIPQAPSIYNLNEKNRSMQIRYKNVLNILVKNGNITQEQSKIFREMYLAS